MYIILRPSVCPPYCVHVSTEHFVCPNYHYLYVLQFWKSHHCFLLNLLTVTNSFNFFFFSFEIMYLHLKNCFHTSNVFPLKMCHIFNCLKCLWPCITFFALIHSIAQDSIVCVCNYSVFFFVIENMVFVSAVCYMFRVLLFFAVEIY